MWDEGEDFLDVVKLGPVDGKPVVTKDLERGTSTTKADRNTLEKLTALGLKLDKPRVCGRFSTPHIKNGQSRRV